MLINITLKRDKEVNWNG